MLAIIDVIRALPVIAFIIIIGVFVLKGGVVWTLIKLISKIIPKGK